VESAPKACPHFRDPASSVIVGIGFRDDLMRYAIVIEKAENNYSGHVPDLPGCVATGATIEETERLVREAIEFHLAGLQEDGLPIPEPSSHVEYVDVAL
jgi:predicted RNase H-like HicB family nuclease